VVRVGSQEKRRICRSLTGEVEVYWSPVADLYTVATLAVRSDYITINAIPGVLIPVARIFA
jgi:hypothetical protein